MWPRLTRIPYCRCLLAGLSARPLQSPSRPRRRAMAAASPRVAAPSLASSRDTWTLAVFSLMNSRSPICRLVRPLGHQRQHLGLRGASRTGPAAVRPGAEPSTGGWGRRPGRSGPGGPGARSPPASGAGPQRRGGVVRRAAQLGGHAVAVVAGGQCGLGAAGTGRRRRRRGTRWRPRSRPPPARGRGRAGPASRLSSARPVRCAANVSRRRRRMADPGLAGQLAPAARSGRRRCRPDRRLRRRAPAAAPGRAATAPVGLGPHAPPPRCGPPAPGLRCGPAARGRWPTSRRASS